MRMATPCAAAASEPTYHCGIDLGVEPRDQPYILAELQAEAQALVAGLG